MIRARFAKHYPTFSLDVEFEAQPGVTVLYGPSGAGKTLTLDCLAGFTAPDTGRILLNDEILFDAGAKVNLPPQRRNCGYVFQDHALFPHMTLFANLAFAAERHPRLERHRRVSDMLERFRISEFAHRLPDQVSGGQKQRCSVARALIAEPRMLLLDEPARGLDASLRNDLYDLAGQIRSEYQIPILLVTHDLSECFALGDVMLVLENGRILQSGTPRAIYDRPAKPGIARLLGIANLFEAEVLALDPGCNSSRILLLGQQMAAAYLPGRLLGDRVTVSIPAAHVKLRDKPGPNCLSVTLRRRTEFADTVRLEFENGITAEAPLADDASRKEWFVELPPASLRVAS